MEQTPMFYRNFLSKHTGVSSLQHRSTSNVCHKQQCLFWAPKTSNCLQHSPNTWVFCYFPSFMKWDDCSAVSSSNALLQSATSEARQRQVRFSLWLNFADLFYTSGKRLRDNIVVIKIYLGRISLQAVSLFWMKCSELSQTRLVCEHSFYERFSHWRVVISQIPIIRSPVHPVPTPPAAEGLTGSLVLPWEWISCLVLPCVEWLTKIKRALN